jgi:hypothetical protein
MAEDKCGKHLSRRVVLKVLAGGAVGAAARGNGGALWAADGTHCAPHAVARAAAAHSAASAVPQFFSVDQLRTVTAIAEALIPADEHSTGAAGAGVPAYIDTVLPTSTQEQRDLWMKGLAAMDLMAGKEFAARFADCTPSQQEQLLLKISVNEDHPSTIEEKFFVAAKNMTIDGYYNSEIGLDQDLQYVGNEALAEFEGCTHPEHGAPAPGKA